MATSRPLDLGSDVVAVPVEGIFDCTWTFERDFGACDGLLIVDRYLKE